MKQYYVYIATNKNRGVLYIGVTNSIERRWFEHHSKRSQFTSKYNLDKIVYVEYYQSPQSAIQREKQLKRWHREWKINLVEQSNPNWIDLSQQ